VAGSHSEYTLILPIAGLCKIKIMRGQHFLFGSLLWITLVFFIICPASATTPVTSFSGTPVNGTVPLTVTFTDTSIYSPSGWAWYFGDENYTTKTWVRQSATAAWPPRGGHTSVALRDGTIVLMGGHGTSEKYNDVWKSSDNGVTWTEQTQHAAWSARDRAVSVTLNDGTILLMGGIDGDWVHNDIWQSKDRGISWTKITTHASWLARYDSTAVVLPDKSIVVMGGSDTSQLRNDVWRSTDNGASWTEQTGHAPWPPRTSPESLALPNGDILLIGGDGPYNDVWKSSDKGVTWTEVNASAGWQKRNEHRCVLLPDGSIFLMGGYYNGLLNDVWMSNDNGTTWDQLTTNAGWPARDYHSTVVLPDGSIILTGGDAAGSPLNDVWRLETATGGQSPSHTYTVPGNYSVILQAFNDNGYDTDLRPAFITANTNTTVHEPNSGVQPDTNFTLPTSETPDESTGSLSVNTSPSGAYVIIDGILKGVSPAIIPGLSAGNHTLLIRHEGYQELTVPLTITGGRNQEYMTSLLPLETVAATANPTTKPYTTTSPGFQPGSGIVNPPEKWINAAVPVQPDILGILLNIYAVKIHAPAPVVPQLIPLYEGLLNEGDVLYFENGDVLATKASVPSEQEAPHIVQQLFEQYGGFPPDAELLYSNISYLKKISISSGEVIKQWPMNTNVIYGRNKDGMPFIGASDKIDVELGENGTPLRAYKVWRTLKYIGNTTCIISPQEAIGELHDGRFVEQPPDYVGLAVDNITLGYYEESRTDPDIYIVPVWMFSGTTNHGYDHISVEVPAGKTAHFVTAPVANATPLTVSFTGISSDPLNEWQWDFGDGSTATGQNTVHTFQAPGNYTVTLVAGDGQCRNLLSEETSVLSGDLPAKAKPDLTQESISMPGLLMNSSSGA